MIEGDCCKGLDDIMKRKLPVLATSLAVFQFVFHNAGYALRITVFWAVILRVLLVLMMIFGVNAAVHYGYTACVILAWCAIAVLWHRRILRNEEATGLPIGLGARTWRYLLSLFEIADEMMLPILLGPFLSIAILCFMILVPLPLPDSALLILLMTAVPPVAILLIILARLSLILPAVALDDGNVDCREAWAATSGNSLRLLGIIMLTFLPFLLAALSIGHLLGEPGYGDDFSLGQFALSAVQLTIGFASAVVAVTAMSFVYAFLINGAAPRIAGP